jgi:hypothetical protein
MRIERLTAGIIRGYDQYLIRKNHSLLYYSSKYKEFLKNLLGCRDEYYVAMEGDEIRGFLPLMYNVIDSDRVYNALPYYGSIGGILADNKEAYDALVRTYNDIASKKTTLSATLISNPLTEHKLTGITHNFTDYRISQITTLSDKDEILGRIESSARRNVRKALREGVTVKVENDRLDRLCEMHQENIRSIGGVPKSERFFSLVSETFLPGDDFDVYVAKLNGAVIAGLLVFYFNKTVEYFIPATDTQYRSIQPLAPILHAAMTDAARRGFVWWNWGGTWASQTGVYRFKRKWAAEEGRYYYYTQLNDDSLLSWTPENILETFPNFFIVPFSALNKGHRQ